MHIYRRARHGWCAAANRSWSVALSGDGRCAFPGRIEVMAFAASECTSVYAGARHPTGHAVNPSLGARTRRPAAYGPEWCLAPTYRKFFAASIKSKRLASEAKAHPDRASEGRFQPIAGQSIHTGCPLHNGAGRVIPCHSKRESFLLQFRLLC